MADNGVDVFLQPTSTLAAAKDALKTLGLTEVFFGEREGTIALTWNNASNAGGPPQIGDLVRITIASGASRIGELTAFSGGAKTASVKVTGDPVDEFEDIGGLKAGTLLEILDANKQPTGTYAEIAADVTTIDVDLGPLSVADKFDRHVAVKYWPNIVEQFATYDQDGNELTPPVMGGPTLMIRANSDRARRKMRKIFYEPDLDQDGNLVRKALPAGIQFANITTHRWL